MADQNPYKDEIVTTLWQTLALLVRVGTFAAAVLAHWTVHHYLLPLAVPESWRFRILPPLEVLFFIAFVVVYVQQMFDMATVFVPWLRHKSTQPAEEAVASREAET